MNLESKGCKAVMLGWNSCLCYMYAMFMVNYMIIYMFDEFKTCLTNHKHVMDNLIDIMVKHANCG